MAWALGRLGVSLILFFYLRNVFPAFPDRVLPCRYLALVPGNLLFVPGDLLSSVVNRGVLSLQDGFYS